MGTFKPRTYQEDLITAYELSCQSHRATILQLATGGGKTLVFSFIIRSALAQGLKCLVLAHRVELILQAVDKIEAITDEPVGIIKAGYVPEYDRPIQVASVQSIVRRLKQCPKFDLIVVDETHHATSPTYQKILAHYPTAKVLGVTATPCRLDGKGFRPTFTDLITGITTKELIKLEALCSYKYFAPDKTMSLVGVRKEQGDYKASDVALANPVHALAADIIKAYRDYADGKQVVIFCVSVEYSILIAEHLNAAGIVAAHLDGTSPADERLGTMNAFKAREIAVLCNCALFDEGLDIPGIDGVILARPTAALSRYLQMVGRSLRPQEGKSHAIVVDLASNYERHGFPCDDRNWTLDGVKSAKRTKTKLVRNKETGEVEEVAINLNENARKFVEISSGDISPETLGDWFNLVTSIHEQMQAEDRNRSWCWDKLMSSPTKPPLGAWQLLGKKLGYHHGWSQYRVNEWVDPATIEVKPVVEPPVIAAIEPTSFVKKAHITESASDIRNLFGEIKKGTSKKKLKAFAKESAPDLKEGTLTSDELEDMFASSKPGRAQAKTHTHNSDFVERWNQLEPMRLRPAKPILKKSISPENLI